MDLANVIVECHTRERALMLELEAAKIARIEAEVAKREALAEKEAVTRERDTVTREKEAATLLAEKLRGEKAAATRLAESLKREVETLRASTGSVEKAVQKALKDQKERTEKEAAEALVKKKERAIWLRSPEALRKVLAITARQGFSAKGFKNLSRAFRYDEQLWDAIKDRCGPNGVTYLMVAAETGDVERVRWLLKREANLDAARSADGMTALIWASEKGHDKVAQLLIGKGQS